MIFPWGFWLIIGIVIGIVRACLKMRASLFALALLALPLAGCKPSSQVARAVAAVALVGEDLADHRPPAGFCDAVMWRDFLPEPWAIAKMRLSPFRIEGQPIVTIGKTIQVDFVASMVTADGGRARVDMRALLRKSDAPCVLIFTERHESTRGPVGVPGTHGENGGDQ